MSFRRTKLLKCFESVHRFYTISSTIRSKNINIKKIGPVTCIGLNRPSKKNCLNLSLVKELHEAVETFEKDGNSNAAVLYGERGNFSYGIDSDEFLQDPRMIENIDNVGLIEKYPVKPIVAAVSGFAVGAGFDLALWTDFRIVEDTALMGGYARRFGMPVNDVILKRMYSLLGFHKAMDLILTGRLINAKEALDCGVATRIVACGTGLGQAVGFAHSLANMPQACLKADRAAIISLSGKYSDETNKFIQKERERYLLMALKEAEDGLHMTESGDVRVKKS